MSCETHWQHGLEAIIKHNGLGHYTTYQIPFGYTKYTRRMGGAKRISINEKAVKAIILRLCP